jgi:hypothetical protein
VPTATNGSETSVGKRKDEIKQTAGIFPPGAAGCRLKEHQLNRGIRLQLNTLCLINIFKDKEKAGTQLTDEAL